MLLSKHSMNTEDNLTPAHPPAKPIDNSFLVLFKSLTRPSNSVPHFSDTQLYFDDPSNGHESKPSEIEPCV